MYDVTYQVMHYSVAADFIILGGTTTSISELGHAQLTLYDSSDTEGALIVVYTSTSVDPTSVALLTRFQ